MANHPVIPPYCVGAITPVELTAFSTLLNTMYSSIFPVIDKRKIGRHDLSSIWFLPSLGITIQVECFWTLEICCCLKEAINSWLRRRELVLWIKVRVLWVMSSCLGVEYCLASRMIWLTASWEFGENVLLSCIFGVGSIDRETLSEGVGKSSVHSSLHLSLNSVLTYIPGAATV